MNVGYYDYVLTGSTTVPAHFHKLFPRSPGTRSDYNRSGTPNTALLANPHCCHPTSCLFCYVVKIYVLDKRRSKCVFGPRLFPEEIVKKACGQQIVINDY